MPARFGTLGGILAMIGLVLVIVLVLIGRLELVVGVLLALAFAAILL